MKTKKKINNLWKEGIKVSEEKQNNENVENEVAQKEQVSELEQTKQELEELTDRYKRVMAEFENYKKKSSKRQRNFIWQNTFRRNRNNITSIRQLRKCCKSRNTRYKLQARRRNGIKTIQRCISFKSWLEIQKKRKC